MRPSKASPMDSIRAAITTPGLIARSRRLYRRHRDPIHPKTPRQARDFQLFLTLLLLRIAESNHLCKCAACRDINAFLSSPA